LGEHLTQKQIEDYCQQRLAVDELLWVSDHLGDCESCQQQIGYGQKSDAAFFALRAEVFGEAAEISTTQMVRTHLTVEETAGYIDSKLTGEELQRVADHLTTCAFCTRAVDDLHSFKNQISTSLEDEYYPATVPPQTESWWQRTASSLPALFRRSPGLAFGTVMAVLLLAATSWLIWRSTRALEQPQEIITYPPPIPATPSMPSPPQPTSIPLVAQLNDGEGQMTLDMEGKLSGADGLPQAYQSMLKKALTSRRIESSPQLKGLVRSTSPLMSKERENSEFSVLEPVGRVLLTNRPTFRWTPMEGATAYVVEIFDSRFNLVMASPQLTSRLWVLPQSLARAKVYSWQVKAIKDGQVFSSPRPPAPQANFRILDEGKVNELAKARRAYATSHLTLGLLYAEAGLLKEAEQELRILQKANPDSEIARSLLKQVQALRH
jgi:hypothetical protein